MNEVLAFPRPFSSAETDAAWLLVVVEADWLFRHGVDTVDIGAALSLHEEDALRAVQQGRAARLASREGSNVTGEVGSTAEVIPGGGSVA